MSDLLARASNEDLEDARQFLKLKREATPPHLLAYLDLAAECIEIVRLLRESGAAEWAASQAERWRERMDEIASDESAPDEDHVAAANHHDRLLHHATLLRRLTHPVDASGLRSTVMCPLCDRRTEVINTRTVYGGTVIYRRRVCPAAHRFSTRETYAKVLEW